MTKGSVAMGKKSSKKNRIACRRCGKITYHIRQKTCSSCGFGRSSRLRSYNWKKEGK